MKVIKIYESINLDKIKLKTSYMISKHKIVLAPIEYGEHNFIVQTPDCKILKSIPNEVHNRYFKLGLLFEHFKFNCNDDIFLKKLIEIEEFIFQKYIKKRKLQGKKLISSIKKDNCANAFFNVNIQINNHTPLVTVFDRDKNIRTLEYIEPFSYSKNLIYLKDLWLINDKIGLNWILVQTKIYPPFLTIKECLIEDDEVFCNTTPKKDKIIKKNYDKFIKMKKFGVHMSAIEIELKKHQLDINEFLELIHSPEDKEHKKVITPIKRNLLKINPNMLQSIKLKKPKKRRNKKKKKIKNIIDKVKQKGYKPPSKKQLQKILKKLKKR